MSVSGKDKAVGRFSLQIKEKEVLFVFFLHAHPPTDREDPIQSIGPGVRGWDKTLVSLPCSLARPSAVSTEQRPSSSSFPDLRAPHVLPLPRVHLCPALDGILRTKRRGDERPESERIQLHSNTNSARILEQGDPEHPSADGSQ